MPWGAECLAGKPSFTVHPSGLEGIELVDLLIGETGGGRPAHTGQEVDSDEIKPARRPRRLRVVDARYSLKNETFGDRTAGVIG